MSTSPTIRMFPIRISQRIVAFRSAPNTSVLPTTAVNTVTRRTATPAVKSRPRLLSRIRNGLGRLLRGTAQAVLMTFWIATPRPMQP